MTIDQDTSFYTIKGGAKEENIIQEILNGLSAYEIWLELGNSGTKQDFIDSLQGDTGATGAQGATGPQGDQGDPGADGADIAPPSFNAQTGTSYTIDDDDLAGSVILTMNNSSANTVNVPAGLTGMWPLLIFQIGTGTTTIAATGGASVLSVGSLVDIRAQHGAVHLVPMGSDVYRLAGDLA